MCASTWLEGSYTEHWPTITEDGDGMLSCSASSRSRAACRAMSRPRRPAPSTRAASSATRSSHAYGAALDRPDLTVACVIGDGEAETGPLAASWHANKFLNPATDGAVCRSCT